VRWPLAAGHINSKARRHRASTMQMRLWSGVLAGRNANYFGLGDDVHEIRLIGLTGGDCVCCSVRF